MRLPLKEYEVDTLIEFIENVIVTTIVDLSTEKKMDLDYIRARIKAKEELKSYIMELIGEYEQDERRI